MTSLARIPLALALSSVLSFSCVPWSSQRHPTTAEQQAAQSAFGTVSTGRISVREEPGKPRITTVVRHGDPSGAITALVVTENSIRSVALGTIVRERLQATGIKNTEMVADRFGYRVTALVNAPGDVGFFLKSLRTALDTPILPNQVEIASAESALTNLHHHPLDSPALLPINECTGELGEPSGIPKVNLSTQQGINQLEQWRAEFHGAQRIALAVVGPPSLRDEALKFVSTNRAWPEVSPPRDPWPESDRIGAFALPGTNTQSPRLTVAARLSPTFAVSALAQSTFDEKGPLASRLAASTSWKLIRTTATVRPRGACLAITVERDPARKDADLAEDAARIASVIQQEIHSEFELSRADASIAGERVLGAADPREAASLAAWWSHAARLPAGPTRFSIALGIPPVDLDPKSGPAQLDRQVASTQSALRSAIPKLATSWTQPTIETITRIENGQGKLWLLVASPCGTTAETEADAGFTALAVVAAARARNATSNVTLEPWIAQDGVGILAHASPLTNESPSMLAKRVAHAAASALLGPPPSEQFVAEARSQLLSLIDSPYGPHAEPSGLLARALSPRQPAWLVPLGLPKALVEADGHSIELRRSALANGPLRVAVLAYSDKEQAEVAFQTVDRWIVHRGSTPRTCPPVAAPSQTRVEAKEITIRTQDRPPLAVLGMAIKAPTPSDILMLELLREALGGKKGAMTAAFQSFEGPVRVRVRTTGSRHKIALIIELSCADALMDRAMQQAKSVLSRFRRGAVAPETLQQSIEQFEHDRQERLFDPRNRLARAWRLETAPPTPPSLQDWQAWLAKTLSEDGIAAVRVRPSADDEDN